MSNNIKKGGNIMKNVKELCEKIYEELTEFDKFCYVTCDEREFYVEFSKDLSENEDINYLCLTQFDIEDLDFDTFFKETRKNLSRLIDLELDDVEYLKTLSSDDKKFVEYLDKKIKGYVELKKKLQ